MPKRHPLDRRDKIAIFVLLGSVVLSFVLFIRAFTLRGTFIPFEQAYQIADIVGFTHLALIIAWAVWFSVKRTVHPDFFALPLKERVWVIGAPVFVLAFPYLSYWGSSMTIAYERHSRLNTEATVVETIKYAVEVGRRARFRRCVALIGDTWLRHKRICGLRSDDYDRAKPNMKITLIGTISSWGFHVKAYRLSLSES